MSISLTMPSRYLVKAIGWTLGASWSFVLFSLRSVVMDGTTPWQQRVFRAQEPKAPVTYCDHALSGVRRPSSVVRRPSSVVCRPLDYLHFRLLLQNRLMDFYETWYGWSTQGPLQVLLFFGQIRPGADPGRGKNRSRGVPFFRKLLLQTGRLQQQTECIAVI